MVKFVTAFSLTVQSAVTCLADFILNEQGAVRFVADCNVNVQCA